MNRFVLRPAWLIVAAAAALGGCTAPASRPERPARIDPQADEALRRMSGVIAAARSFSLQSTSTMDEPLANGQLAEFTRETRVVVRRPDRLFAEVRRGDNHWLLWHAGGELTVLEKSDNVWASAAVPARIDDMLDELANKYGLTMPLADLLFTDPYQVLTADTLTGRFVGIHEVSGTPCCHLLFTQESVDWQIWIDTGKTPLPRKIVIDYKNLTGRPQFSGILSQWNLAPAAGDDLFRPAIPKDARKIEMAQLLSAGQRQN
jgi:hypothetical protein